jgi:glycosyltransferase involved in cell wall biosynthesis
LFLENVESNNLLFANDYWRPMMTADMSETELTILIPCLDEVETIAACVQEAVDFLRRSGIKGEVLVADNGSCDGSPDIARANGARVEPVSIRGYGAALIHGCLVAKGRWIIMGDADHSYDFSNLEGFVEKLRNGCDLVMGNRFQGGIETGAMPWKNRLLGNPVLSGIGRLFFRIRQAGDFHCGLRGFSKAAFLRMHLKTTGMEFASEMVIKAALLGMRIEEIPTRLRKDGRTRRPHLRPWRDGWRHLSFMLLYSPRWLYLYPGLVMLFGGFLCTLLLMFGDRTVCGLTFSIQSQMVFAGISLLGIQALIFSFITKAIMMKDGLLPFDIRVNIFINNRYLLLYIGIIIGILGLIGIIWGTSQWYQLLSGTLDVFSVVRITIPSVFALITGVELAFLCVFMTYLTLNNCDTTEYIDKQYN